jgi:hypothetical protein
VEQEQGPRYHTSDPRLLCGGSFTPNAGGMGNGRNSQLYNCDYTLFHGYISMK